MEQNFDLTLSCIADAFKVNDIATYELVTCKKNEDHQSVIIEHQEYDQIPIQDGDQIIGVVERIIDQVSTSFRVHSLDDGILVSADESLVKFLPLLAKPPFYRLVLKGSNIQGIVTKSDALKLPVRLYSFALITQLEMLMIQKIHDEMKETSEWWKYLSDGRQKKINEKCERFKRDRMDPSLIELTDFCDKKTILKKRFKLSSTFESDLQDIEELRNDLAHATTFIRDDQDLIDLIDILNKCSTWINEIPKLKD